jgi:secondary thiamine-phosphate synthase enzyme
MLHRFNIRTRSKTDFYEITREIRDAVISEGVKNGICYVFIPHTTAGVTVNEHADPDVVVDIIARLDALVPQSTVYRHAEGNSPAHIKASLTGSSLTLFIEDSKLILGTWQGVFFCEYDGPRNRNVILKIVPG